MHDKDINTEFTFHYVSIKSKPWSIAQMTSSSYLHSTMYLLNRLLMISQTAHRIWFTFHYVSIKSLDRFPYTVLRYHLHSTMYLLNRVAFVRSIPKARIFTFHYVSIKSYWWSHKLPTKFNLHSTMYLLNLRSEQLNMISLLIYIPLCIY